MSMIDEVGLDELGPIDYTVVEFPAGAQVFAGEVGDELLRLVDTEVIRVLDLIVITKDADGVIDAVEIEDSAEREQIRRLADRVAEVLATDDVTALAAAMAPGSVAGVLVWENTWAAPFAGAVRRCGGQLIAGGRIPIPAILASFQDDLLEADPEDGRLPADLLRADASRQA